MPTALLLAALVVDPTQKSEPRSTGLATSATGGVAVPETLTAPPRAPRSRKQGRFVEKHVFATPPQSVSFRQPRCAWPDAMVQVPSTGPSWHSPRPSRSGSVQTGPGFVVSSTQSFG